MSWAAPAFVALALFAAPAAAQTVITRFGDAPPAAGRHEDPTVSENLPWGRPYRIVATVFVERTSPFGPGRDAILFDWEPHLRGPARRAGADALVGVHWDESPSGGARWACALAVVWTDAYPARSARSPVVAVLEPRNLTTSPPRQREADARTMARAVRYELERRGWFAIPAGADAVPDSGGAVPPGALEATGGREAAWVFRSAIEGTVDRTGAAFDLDANASGALFSKSRIGPVWSSAAGMAKRPGMGAVLLETLTGDAGGVGDLVIGRGRDRALAQAVANLMADVPRPRDALPGVPVDTAPAR